MNLADWLSLLESRHPQAIELGLERCGSVYRRLGSPRPGRTVVTVAGTNGKGSTVAYLDAICAGAGLRCGTYTSPHVFRFNERVRITGEAVSDDALVGAFERVEAAREDVSLTYFEFTTLAALLLMEGSALDVAVLEVGLGGRLDTVNLVDADFVVITPIGLDHQEYLGNDLASIAREKAGVIRPGAVVVCTEPAPPAPVRQAASERGARLFCRGRDFDLAPVPNVPQQCRFTMQDVTLDLPPPPMAGPHQLDNLAAALATMAVAHPGVMSRRDAVVDSLGRCSLPGRLQAVSSAPEVLIDVGHNALAAVVVAEYLVRRGRRVTCVLAMLKDKPAEAVGRELGGVCAKWLCADTPGERGQSGERLAVRLQSALAKADIRAFGPLEDALQTAVSEAMLDETILVFGSFSTAATAADWLQTHLQHHAGDADRIGGVNPQCTPGAVDG